MAAIRDDPAVHIRVRDAEDYRIKSYDAGLWIGYSDECLGPTVEVSGSVVTAQRLLRQTYADSMQVEGWELDNVKARRNSLRWTKAFDDWVAVAKLAFINEGERFILIVSAPPVRRRAIQR